MTSFNLAPMGASRVLAIVVLAVLPFGLAASQAFSAETGGTPAKAPPTTTVLTPAEQRPIVLSPEELKRREEWRALMARRSLPKKGCFTSSYPSTQWKEIPCGAPSKFPNPPHGPRPDNVGNGNDVSAQVPAHITWSEGSFDNITGAASLAGPLFGSGPDVNNVWMLQINTQFFTNPPACASHPGCMGWQQFLYSQTQCVPGPGQSGVVAGTAPCVFMEYWLIGYGSPCPSGQPWIADGFGDCWFNGPSVYVPPQSVATLASLKMTATANNAMSQDTVALQTSSGTITAVGAASILDVGNYWNTSEFNIFGDCCSSQTNFSNPTSVTVRTNVSYGSPNPPSCVAQGFTAETNNLNFGSPPAATTNGTPAVIFTESSAGGAPSPCASAVSVGDTHLLTFAGTKYDFQATGDFILAQSGPGFLVETRQVVGPPQYPNTAVNQGVAARIGNARVAVCLAPTPLYVDGKATALADGKSVLLPGGVTVAHRGDTYTMTGRNGDAVRAEVVAGLWINVTVGLSRGPLAGAHGLLANANGNIAQIAMRNGTVLNEPVAFSDLYHRYADSWRVRADENLLAPCGKTTISGIPKVAFFAKNLAPMVAAEARATCLAAGVRQGPLLDDCTLDTAVMKNKIAVRVFTRPLAVRAVLRPDVRLELIERAPQAPRQQ